MKIDFCPEEPCLGLECPRMNTWAGHQSMGMMIFPQSEQDLTAEIARLDLAQQLAISYASGADGIKRSTVDMDFLMHPVEKDGAHGYAAVYCGALPPEEMLAASPEWSEDMLPELLKAAAECAGI